MGPPPSHISGSLELAETAALVAVVERAMTPVAAVEVIRAEEEGSTRRGTN
jgi:hypothetical protein